jgi:PAS domain S-box-containing protein
MRTPFFRQMALYDSTLTLLTVFPEEEQVLNTLTEEEQATARRTLTGVAQDTVLYPAAAGESTQVVFMAPVNDAATGQAVAVLMGVAELDASPFMQSVASTLNGLAGGEGNGFIVDSQGYVIFPTPQQNPLPTFSIETSAAALPTDLADATAYQDKAPDGTRRLVLFYKAPGHDWNVVVTVPNRWVLAVATQISQPIILILLLIGLIGLLLVSLIATQVTRPAEALALAAQRISEGRLDLPVVVEGEDEIGRAGLAFERMRQKLRARLDELGLLLRVSQGVSSHLNLDEALPPILDGALTATGAAGARVVLLPKDGEPPDAYQTHTTGDAAALMAALDGGVVELTRREGRLVIENLARARAVLDVAPMAGKLHALAALPLRQELTYYGVLWLGYTQPHPFTETEVNFLTTLAGQAAVAVANARLFEAAEQGRQRLAAILASTPDAVIVTDREARLLLLNPAAEKVLNLAKGGVGQPAANVLPNPELAKLLTESRASAATIEVELAGKTLSASASTIISADGSVVGRVGILRDVTRFKEVDAMKSEFVATVSHDLRAPLTFMRGYATMLPMVGSLNDKQREFAEKIILGIEQMTNLIDDLLDLGRIEAGIGLAREACRIDQIIAGVMDTVKPQALNKGLNLLVDVSPDLPTLSGDPTLLRQAISNLVENAIKYTPSGGQVGVSVTTDQNRFTLAVSDTGVGIAPADQARLFEKFFRVKQRGSTHVKGSGLGLAIVKSIVERHGGRVWVDSKLGKGSIFYVELPRNGAFPESPNR